MPIINGWKKPWKYLRNLCIHAYKWHDCDTNPDINKKFSKIGVRLEHDKWEEWMSLFIVFWPRRYIVVSWRSNDKCGVGQG